MTDRKQIFEEFGKLLDILDELREKCPWDKKQTFESLRKLTIEETYELADAIISGSDNEIKNELGDLALHIVFYAKIGSEKGHLLLKMFLGKSTTSSYSGIRTCLAMLRFQALNRLNQTGRN